MKQSVITHTGLFLVLWRASLKPDAFRVVPVVTDGVAFPWWGSNLRIEVREGDELVMMPSPWGFVVDQIQRPEPVAESIGEAA